MKTDAGLAQVSSAIAPVLADVESGQILSVDDLPTEESQVLFAAASTQLLECVDVGWETLSSSFRAPPSSLQFQDILLVSDANIFVAQRLKDDPSLAWLSIVPSEKGPGLALRESRERAAKLAIPR